MAPDTTQQYPRRHDLALSVDIPSLSGQQKDDRSASLRKEGRTAGWRGNYSTFVGLE